MLRANDVMSCDWYMLIRCLRFACASLLLSGLSKASNSTSSGSGGSSNIDMDLLAQAFSYAASLEEQQVHHTALRFTVQLQQATLC
jgi:hypothetical protein